MQRVDLAVPAPHAVVRRERRVVEARVAALARSRARGRGRRRAAGCRRPSGSAARRPAAPPGPASAAAATTRRETPAAGRPPGGTPAGSRGQDGHRASARASEQRPGHGPHAGERHARDEEQQRDEEPGTRSEASRRFAAASRAATATRPIDARAERGPARARCRPGRAAHRPRQQDGPQRDPQGAEQRRDDAATRTCAAILVWDRARHNHPAPRRPSAAAPVVRRVVTPPAGDVPEAVRDARRLRWTARGCIALHAAVGRGQASDPVARSMDGGAGHRSRRRITGLALLAAAGARRGSGGGARTRSCCAAAAACSGVDRREDGAHDRDRDRPRAVTLPAVAASRRSWRAAPPLETFQERAGALASERRRRLGGARALGRGAGPRDAGAQRLAARAGARSRRTPRPTPALGRVLLDGAWMSREDGVPRPGLRAVRRPLGDAGRARGRCSAAGRGQRRRAAASARPTLRVREAEARAREAEARAREAEARAEYSDGIRGISPAGTGTAYGYGLGCGGRLRPSATVGPRPPGMAARRIRAPRRHAAAAPVRRPTPTPAADRPAAGDAASAAATGRPSPSRAAALADALTFA